MSRPARKPRIVVVAGPTCSGKSALALDLAQALGGCIINADSMQLYRELRVVTARPSPAEEAVVPHYLYGVRPAAEAASAAWWREAAVGCIAAVLAQGKLPVLCGGTGLYFSTLLAPLAAVPAPGEAARAEARALLGEIGAPALHARLAAVDPATAAALRPSDSQRVARAWEVWVGTGRGLAAWQAASEAQEAPYAVDAVLLEPDRAMLRAAIAARCTAMVAAGAVQEVRALLALGLDPALPAMRAHGVPELAAHLRGEISLSAAVARMAVVTGQYTKRQATWFRHRHIAAAPRTHRFLARYGDSAQESQRFLAEFIHYIREAG